MKKIIKKIGVRLLGGRQIVPKTEVHIIQVNYGEILKGKTVLVTGGSSGIGLAIAKTLHRAGANVVVTGRSQEKLQAVCDEVESDRLFGLVWDVSNVVEMSQKLREAVALCGSEIDILVNNAGVYLPTRMGEVTEELWDAMEHTNSKGLFFLTQELVTYWRQNKRGGKIINIASTSGLMGAYRGPYEMGKWGVIGLTKGLGRTLFSENIIVNAIAPGITASGMNNYSSSNAYCNFAPSYRVSLPEEIAEIALFLCSDAANHVVGQVIACDGGQHLKTEVD